MFDNKHHWAASNLQAGATLFENASVAGMIRTFSEEERMVIVTCLEFANPEAWH